MQDWELIDDYAKRRSEEAFAELVSRYVNLVYSAALRAVQGDVSLAEEATQRTFCLLARRAGGLSRKTIIVGWLYRTASNMGRDVLRAERMSDYALGFICDMGSPGIKHVCRTGFAGRAPAEDYPLASRFDEVDTLVIFDDVEIPWENVLFYRHTRAATFIRATLHRYSAFPYIQRILRVADMLIGAALLNVRQTGLERQQAVQEKLAQLACYREGINAHLTAAIAEAEESPGGLLMPNQSLLYTGRVLACTQLPAMMHISRELCGGQICVTPDEATFRHPETGPWMEKFYSINERWSAEDRRRLLAFARDLLNSDYAGHRLTFELFAQSPPFAHLAAVYRNFDFDHALDVVRESAGLSSSVLEAGRT